ncbi:MAG: FtsQ-type POTRA domain-containing protein [Verrucomicrobia bacterium]|nr:FtsQ-type POTRA domain-containing protein [Verrucomicrobiota bacterium]
MFERLFKNPRESRRKQRDPYRLNVKVRAPHRTQAQLGKAVMSLAVLLTIGLVSYGSFRAFQYFVQQAFTTNAKYNITAIQVENDGGLSREEIVTLAGVREGQNLYAVDLGAIRGTLESNPMIRRAEIHRVLPDKLRIVVSERVPAAQFFTRALYDGATRRVITPPMGYLIGSDGVVMKPVNPFAVSKDTARLPLLTGVEPGEIKLGQPLSGAQVLSGLNLIHLCQSPDIAPLLDYERIDLSRKGALVMVTRYGGQISFALDDLPAQLKRLKTILIHPSRAGQIIRTCDLSVQMNVPVTYFAPVSANPDVRKGGIHP